MTLMQAHITTQRALIVTDTSVYRGPDSDVVHWPDGTPVAAMKQHFLPHLRAVLVGVGGMWAAPYCAERLLLAASFDDAVSVACRALQEWTGDAGRGTELFLIGWSTTAAAMSCARFAHSDGWRPQLFIPPAGHTVALVHPAAAGLAKPTSMERADAYARAAIQQCRAADPRAPFGGQLHVSEITFDGLAIAVAGDVGYPPRRDGAPDLLDAADVGAFFAGKAAARNLSCVAIPGGVLVTVNPSAEADVVTGGYLELRINGANWAGATRIYRGPADRYTWPWPAAGTYTLRAKWIDSSGNESATDATMSVTVGNGNLIGTAGMTPDAATEAFSDETGADSVTIPGTGGTSFKPCASRTWINTLGRPAIVQFDAEVTGLHFSAGATLASPDDFVSASWVFKVNGTPVATDGFIDTTDDLAPPDATTKRTRMVGWQRTLAAGDTAEVYISCGGGTDSNAATISWARTRLRTTVLKA